MMSLHCSKGLGIQTLCSFLVL